MQFLFIFVSAVLLCSCGERFAGDSRESFADKHEWSILQKLESEARDVDGLGFEFQEYEEYAFVQIPNESGKGAIYIMLNPKSSPFYKQMPSKQFDLTAAEFKAIQAYPKTIATVEQAIESHVVE